MYSFSLDNLICNGQQILQTSIYKDLLRVTSWNQAIELGLGDTLGKVEKGYTADLAVLDAKSFKVKAVFLDGKRRI